MGRTPQETQAESEAPTKDAVPQPGNTADADVLEEAVSSRTKLSSPVRFFLAVVLSFALGSLGQVGLHYATKDELASVAKDLGKWEVGLLAAWRLVMLALCWLGDYDGYDSAALALLSHGPTAFLVSVFYGIRSLTAGAYLLVDILSTSLPFYLLRRVSGAHSAAPGTPNREIVTDKTILALTSLQAALIYSVVLYLATRYFLPQTLVLYFTGIQTVRPKAEDMFLGLGSPMVQVLSLLFGLAARTFIFSPTVTTPRTEEDEKNEEFDPVNATLRETVKWNLWGYTTQTKVSLKRTATAMLVTGLGTVLETGLVLKGVEPYGAVVYAGVWVAAACVTGLGLRYVGSL